MEYDQVCVIGHKGYVHGPMDRATANRIAEVREGLWPLEEIPPPHLFDCGCLLTQTVQAGEKIATLSPCRPGCNIPRMAIEEADDQGKPVRFEER